MLPGWGHWGLPRVEPRWVRDAKAKAAAAHAAALAARADAKKPLVIISEKYDRKAAAFTVPAVPFPFPSKDAFERAMRMPLGRDFNTDAAFRDLTRPAVLADAGALIAPVTLAEPKNKGGGFKAGRPGLGEERGAGKRKGGAAAGPGGAGPGGGKKRRD